MASLATVTTEQPHVLLGSTGGTDSTPTNAKGSLIEITKDDSTYHDKCREVLSLIHDLETRDEIFSGKIRGCLMWHDDDLEKDTTNLGVFLKQKLTDLGNIAEVYGYSILINEDRITVKKKSQIITQSST